MNWSIPYRDGMQASRQMSQSSKTFDFLTEDIICIYLLYKIHLKVFVVTTYHSMVSLLKNTQLGDLGDRVAKVEVCVCVGGGAYRQVRVFVNLHDRVRKRVGVYCTSMHEAEWFIIWLAGELQKKRNKEGSIWGVKAHKSPACSARLFISPVP